MRIVRIYHAGRDSAHRGRDRALAAAGAKLTLVVPERWTDDNAGTPLVEASFDIIERAVERPGDVNMHRFVDPGALAASVMAADPDLVDLHEEPFSAVTHQLLGVLPRGLAVVGYSAQNLDKRYPPPFTGWERTAFARMTGMYPCSRQAASVLRGRGYRGELRVLPLGFDPAVFRPGTQDHGAAMFTLTLAGRMVPEKGVRDAIEVLAQVRRQRDATLVLAGDGPELGYVDRYAAEAEVTGAVQVRPWCDEHTLADLYRDTHVVLVPSTATRRWVEQFGRTVVEAQASGAAVAAYASGTIPEVASGAAALSAEGDALGLGRATARLASEPALWNDLRQRGFAAAAPKAWDHVARGQLELYAAALESEPRPPVRASRATRSAARHEFGMPARTGDHQTRPFALPVLRDHPRIGRLGGSAVDLLTGRRSTAL
ncbi:MAG TPA: glycosyltransferase [Mycobacteriales bacterium]|nr:glycosyltransferase [Mycobacteriales bacterium]